MIPKIAHFVFGLEEQHEPFHFVHYVSIESCRRILSPDAIFFHYKHLPWGPWWDLVAPFVTLIEVDLIDEVLGADYSSGFVPTSYRYAHHADFVRLDALIEYGGIYADTDTVFVQPFPPEFFEAPFVIGAEAPVPDELTGEFRPSQCNALLMAEPNALFARVWRERMAGELNGTWSNHSGFLSEALSREMPTAVRVEPEVTFFSFPADPTGISQLFEERHTVPAAALSVHLWAHLWWRQNRRDYSSAHADWCTPSIVRRARTTFCDLARPYLPERGNGAGGSPTGTSAMAPDAWLYLSLDDVSGYGIAAARCRAALEDSGLEVDWIPFVPGDGWGLSFQPPPALDLLAPAGPPAPDERHLSAGLGDTTTAPVLDHAQIPTHGQVVVTHLVAEYFPIVRQRCPDAFVVGHTVWETDRIPHHWIPCLNAADLLVVPSNFSAEAIATLPVTTPVAVVPHVAPTLSARPSDMWATVPPEHFVFYTIAEWNERKAVFNSIEAYLRAFTGRDPVLLIVKTSHRDFGAPPPSGRRAVEAGTSAWSLAQLLAHHRDPPAVRLVTRELAGDDIDALHRRGDCFVSLCHSEGWGLGGFDAAAYANPVVTTGFGGQLDYLAGSPYLVDFDLVPVHHPDGFPSYSPDQRWAEPDIDHGSALLREVMAHREPAAQVARDMAQDIRWHYRPEAIAAAFRSAVDTQVALSGGDPRSTKDHSS